MRAMVSQITSLTIVYSTVYSATDQRKHQSSASLAVVRGIKRWPVNSPHKGLITRQMFPFDDVIMIYHNKVGSCHASHWILKNRTYDIYSVAIYGSFSNCHKIAPYFLLRDLIGIHKSRNALLIRWWILSMGYFRFGEDNDIKKLYVAMKSSS